MKDTNCPYCNTSIEINHDDFYGYEEDKTFEQECNECHKTFVYYTSISFSYQTYKADCLNDGEHKFKKTITYPPEFAKLKCDYCGCEKNTNKICKRCNTDPGGCIC